MRIGRRILVGLAAAAALASACSSSSAPACTIAGLYTAMEESLVSGNCPVSASPVTDTLTVSGDTATLVVQGLNGGCAGPITNGCTWTASCPIAVADAITPGAMGTAQYAWTFSSDGFTGTLAISLPPAASLPDGCSGTERVTATRQ